MAVMMPREKWTDERLDDLNKKVDDGFARLDKRIEGLDEDIKDLRRDMNTRFEKVDDRFKELSDSMNARFESLNRNLQASMVAVIAALIGSNAF